MRFSLKKSIYIGVFIPTIAMICFSLYNLYKEYNHYQLLEENEEYIFYTDSINKLVLTLGQERGMSSIVFALPKEQIAYNIPLEQKRKAFDNAVANFELQAKFDSDHKHLYKKIEATLIQIKHTRSMIDTKEYVDIDQFFFGVYTKLENELLALQSHIIDHLPQEIQHDYSNTMYISNMIASSGIARGYISYYLSKQKPLSLEQSRDILLHYYQSTNIIRNTLSNYEFEYLQNKEVYELDEKIKQYISQIEQVNVEAALFNKDLHYPLEAIEWFDIWTKKIAYLDRVNSDIKKIIEQKYKTLKKQTDLEMLIIMAFVLISFIILVFSFRITQMLTTHIEILSQTLGKLKPLQTNTKEVDFDSNTGLDDALVLIVDTIEEIKKATRSKEQFLANMSHELRTPLNSIIGFSQIIEKKDGLPSDVKKMVERICISGKHLLGVINSILEFAKISSGKMELNKVEVPVENLFAEVLSVIEPLTKKKGINLIVKEDFGVVYVDPLQFKTVLLNLLSNAIKFTPDGRTITLEYRYNNEHIFSVCDEGFGIESDKIEAIFEPFKQLKHDRNIIVAGTGLGLAITKEIVRLHEGDMRLQSVVGEGTCVDVVLSEKRGK